MTPYKAIRIDGKTLWVPQDQPAAPVPKPATKKTTTYSHKRMGKQYGERKNWW